MRFNLTSLSRHLPLMVTMVWFILLRATTAPSLSLLTLRQRLEHNPDLVLSTLTVRYQRFIERTLTHTAYCDPIGEEAYDSAVSKACESAIADNFEALLSGSWLDRFTLDKVETDPPRFVQWLHLPDARLTCKVSLLLPSNAEAFFDLYCD